MRALDRDIRKQLERAVRAARIAAEEGAARKLTELGVFDARAPQHLSNDERSLRVRLRAHARALGDAQKPDDTIVGASLIREVAYEHWHRALFARFLAENAILIEPEHGVPVTLGELEEIAREDGKEPFELAAEWAAPMLPAIFRADDPALAVRLPMESRSELRALVAQLPSAVFYADDSLGWAYQFWQADQKERVNEAAKGGAKIGAEELPAVTQLFTEDYMVLFLLENTLGAWWAGKILAANPELAANAASEDALRAATSPPGWTWTYLRFVRAQGLGELSETWRPASGAFEDWPRNAAAITMLDPCMGSGHFLVFALPILTAMRRAEEDLGDADALLAVLKDNLFGLEIDPRCTQIAAFALALAAWKRLGGWRVLPALNLACSGLAIGMTKTEWLSLADRLTDAWGGEQDLLGAKRPPLGEAAAARMREGLARVYDEFRQAPSLGSLIDPANFESDLFAAETTRIIASAQLTRQMPPEEREVAVIADGLFRAMAILSMKVTLVATNVPFLSRSKQGIHLKQFGERFAPQAKADLANMMLSRCFAFARQAGAVAVVSPQTWYFADALSAFRLSILTAHRVAALLNIGPAAFDDMNWWAAKTALTIVQKDASASTSTHFAAIDLGEHRDFAAKASLIKENAIAALPTSMLLRTPDNRFVLDGLAEGSLLSSVADAYQGISPADAARFSRRFWEIEHPRSWHFWQSTTETTRPSGGKSLLLASDDALREAVDAGVAYIRGQAAWGKRGIVVSQMANLPCALYSGQRFDTNCAVIVPKDEGDLAAIWAFCSSEDYVQAVRKIDQALKVTNSTLVKVPFDREKWTRVAEACQVPQPDTNDPTQWIFDGNVAAATRALHGAVARVLMFRWPRQTGISFLDCPPVSELDAIERSGHVDQDGIVCLAPLYGEPPAVERVRGVLTAAFGEALDLPSLLRVEDAGSHDLESWLRHEFAQSHTKLFYQRPFIWQIWDGLNDGFSALVNYHRLCGSNGEGRRMLEKLRDTYLGEWIAQQQRRFESEEAGAEARLLAARHLSDQLTKIIEGEPPYDIFVRWKPLSEQPIGWAPDINDGIRINIRPFVAASTKNGRSILRYRPTGVKWSKDRGSEQERPREEYPWFWADENDVGQVDFAGGERFKGLRFNDFHYTRAAKEAARRKSTAA